MTTITTTAPSFETPRTSGRRILVAGAIVAGLVVAGSVAIPRITATTSSPSYPAVTPHDAVEHQLDSARAAALGAAARHESAVTEKNLDLGGKQASAAAANRPMSTAFSTTTARQQVGGGQPTFAWVQNHPSSVAKEQIGGAHTTYPSSTLHLTWADRWVPPYDNPEWVPFIKSHYFHPVVSTPVRPTHEYR